MAPGLFADLLVLGHLAFVAFVVLGGVAVWRWPRVAWLHLPAVGWGVGIELTGGVCPLTPWEQALRRQAGAAGYEGDFVAHYLLPVLYPDGLTRGRQIFLGVLLGVMTAAIYVASWRRHRRAARRPSATGVVE